ncbi:hypothetical protein JQS43_09275 [Natronosporangium hydrolyticum]|uniref:Uncharacterized protein n=1 Tax=Natronosporangium hydrolyticum TaxID=2811111 RepID=A0A895YI30_9ACTN|nr:hypothetical protein JQS43_09275 [Natronosporangium hydrolyticum]
MLVTGALAVALVVAWLLAPPMGTDLSAQVARADFFAEHGWAPVDFRWYGGVVPYGYSMVSPPLMAWLGPRPVGAIAAVVSALALVVLLRRTGAPRPLLGGVLGAVGFAGNLVSGRVTFALGVAFGLLALVALTGHGPQLRRWTGALVLAAVAAAASPVAGLFVGLAGVALLCHGWRRRDPTPGGGTRPVVWRGSFRPTDPALGGLMLIAGSGVPVLVMGGWFGTGGWMNMSAADLWQAVVASLVVALLVPHRVVRAGALLSAAGVAAAYLVPTPVGLNATRLAALFALPLVGAYAMVPQWVWIGWRLTRSALGRFIHRAHGWQLRRPVGWLTAVLAGLAVWQPPVVFQDLARAGDPTAAPEHYAALREELAGRQLEGRVEVVPTVNYWEAAHLDTAPLARGWLRQADLDRHPLFFDGTLDADSYQQWLTDNGVAYVVLPQGPVSWVGRPEAELIDEGLPYLDPVWEDDDWVLYKVIDAPAILEGPATLLEMTPQSVVFEVTEADAEVLLRVWWSRRLAIVGDGEACLTAAGEWTEVQVAEPGEYEVLGVVTRPGPRC